MRRIAILPLLAFLLTSLPSARAEDVAVSFKLGAAMANGLKDKDLYAGKSNNFSGGVEGLFYIGNKMSLIVDGGYRYFPDQDLPSGATIKTFGGFGSVLFQQEVLVFGLSYQAGLRYHVLKTKFADSVGELSHSKNGFGLMAGVGYQLDERFRVNLSAFQLKVPTLTRVTGDQSATCLELTLAIRL